MNHRLHRIKRCMNTISMGRRSRAVESGVLTNSRLHPREPSGFLIVHTFVERTASEPQWRVFYSSLSCTFYPLLLSRGGPSDGAAQRHSPVPSPNPAQGCGPFPVLLSATGSSCCTTPSHFPSDLFLHRRVDKASKGFCFAFNIFLCNSAPADFLAHALELEIRQN